MKKIITIVMLLFSIITQAQFSGTYYIGAGQTYTTLKSFCDALNAGTIEGNITAYITSDLTEASNVGLGVNTNGYSITFKPDADADRTITFTQLADNTSPTGHFVIGYIGAGLSSTWSDANTVATSNVTIDGYSDGGSTRRLIFTNTNNNHVSARVIVVVGGCQNTIIKNCKIYNLTTNTGSPFCVGGVARKGTAIEVAPTNLTIENNILTATGNDVAMGSRLTNSGTLTSIKINGFIFKNNIVTSKRRLLEINYTNGGEIFGNEFNTSASSTAPATVTYGLWTNTGCTGTFNIYKNKFLQATCVENTNGTYGHRVVSLASGATYNIYNNMFSGLNKTVASSYSTSLTYIFFGGSGTIYFNTFYMPALTNATSTGYYACIQLSSSNPTIKNNLFISDEATHSNPYFISGVTTSTSDYNDFYMRQSNANHKVVGSYTSFTAYQSANPTKDVNSLSKNVIFISTSDLHIDTTNANCWNINNKGVQIAGYTTDIDGDTRGSKPDIGADEIYVQGATPSGAPSNSGTTNYVNGGVTRGTINWGAGGTVPSAIDFGYYPNLSPPSFNANGKTYSNLYWHITNTGGSGFSYDVTLTYDEDLLNGITESNLRLAKSEDGGATWTAFTSAGTGAGQYAINTSANTITVYGLTSFSDFILTDVNNPIPVEIVTFTAKQHGSNVTLNWNTATEVRNHGFEIERVKSEQLSANGWSKLGFVNGNGNSNIPHDYTFTDNTVKESGKYIYRLKQIDTDGSFEYSNQIEVNVEIPQVYSLLQNYPNPFNPVTTIQYTIAAPENVLLKIYDITGKEVLTLVNEKQEAGKYEVKLDASKLSSGTYIYRLSAGSFVQTKKMILLK